MCGLLAGWFGRGRISIAFYATFRPLFCLIGHWRTGIRSEALASPIPMLRKKWLNDGNRHRYI